MSEFVLEDAYGNKLVLVPTPDGDFTIGAESPPAGNFSGESVVVCLRLNQAAILHAKLGELLGAPAEEQFGNRVDRLETSINALRDTVSKLAPQAALDALATAFTEEMAKMKDRCDPVLAALAKAPLDDLPESDEERPAVDAAKRGSLLRMPLVTGHHGYSALTPEESRLFRAIEDVTERPLPAVSRVLPNVDVNTALVLAARSWWAKVAKPAIEAELYVLAGSVWVLLPKLRGVELAVVQLRRSVERASDAIGRRFHVCNGLHAPCAPCGDPRGCRSWPNDPQETP